MVAGSRQAGRGRSGIAAGLLGLLLAATAGASGDGTAPAPAPDFVLKSTDGTNVRLSEFRGDVVVVSFFASWCSHCPAQLQALADLEQRYADRGLTVLAVDIDENTGRGGDGNARYPFTVLRDADKSVARAYDIPDLPYVVIVDPDGRMRHAHANFRAGDEASYDAELRPLLQAD